MRVIILLLPALLYSFSAWTQCFTVESVPNTKLVNNSYVSNPDGILSASTVAQIDAALADLENSTTVQVAVVAVNSICSEDIFGFAQDLFTTWGIGQSENDNGVLILLVKDMRTVRFHTGYGVEGVLTDAICKHIQMNSMVPYFKSGDYSNGTSQGVLEVAKVLLDPDYLNELRAEPTYPTYSDKPSALAGIFIVGLIIFIGVLTYLNTNGRFSDSPSINSRKYKSFSLTRRAWIVEFGIVPALILLIIAFGFPEGSPLFSVAGLYFYLLLTAIRKRFRMNKLIREFGDDYFKITEFFHHYQIYWLVMGIVFPLPMLIHYFFYLAQKKHYRNHPRNCPKCSSALNKLDEHKDDEYLRKNQVFEEQLKSVDYDVWLCSNCSFSTTYTFKSRSGRYSDCPKCNTIAFYTKSRTTIVSPTYESSGTGEQLMLCKFCNHSRVSTYSIPRLERSDSSSSSGGSSSGGSWGGGSSGGGGASSSW